MNKLVGLFIFLPFLFFSQSNVKYPSLLWKISGNGLRQPSYLYGTMHVSNRVAYYLSEQFFTALKSVEAVGLETNPGAWLENMERTGELSELSQLRTNGFGRDFYKGAFAVSFPEKRMLQGILSYDPDIINGLLYRQNKTRENFEESTYIDLFIYQSAAKLNKEVISLEDFAQSEIMARLSALPDEESGDDESRKNTHYANAQKIEDAYREGNLDVIDSLSRASSSRNTQRYLISERNAVFANTIDSVLKLKSLFSGVGAAHLPGSSGVIELLRAKGYAVEPVFPEVTKKSNAMREKLDKRVKSVRFSRQFAADSLFSVNLPGRLYPIVNIGNLRYDIYADMANGSFYTVVRLKHFAPLFHLSADQLLQRIDSLLFEHIPGKILHKEFISAPPGIRGIEIVNRIRRGDEQHYQIYFTDLEMIVFKLGGKGAYATGREAKQFFSSVKFHLRGAEPLAFTPPAAGFSVNIPGNYSYSKSAASSITGLVEDLYAYDKASGRSFGVKRAVYNDFSYLEEDTFELMQFARNVLSDFGYKLSPVYRPGKEQGVPCISFSGISKAAGLFDGKIYIKGVHYYLVYQVSPTADSVENAFFKSFRLTPFRYLHPIRSVTDKDFHFTALDEVTDNALSRFNASYARAYERTRKNIPQDTGKDFDFRTGNKVYYSPSSNEHISITFEKYNDYDYRDPAEMSKRIRDSYRLATSMKVVERSGSWSGDSARFRFVLSDTATTRALDVRIFFTGGMMHEISAPFDTTIGLQGWTKLFMDSFRPLDTVIGRNIFENKFHLLLRDLAGSDSLKRRAAETSVQSSVAMQKSYADYFVRFISGDSIHLAGEESRAQLLVNGGTLANEKIIAPYKSLYQHYTDSFYLQLCILKGLAYLRTDASYQAFHSLLLKEPPLVGDENSVADVFAVLHDSLALCRKFFPGLLSLTRFDEFRTPVYSLLAALVNQKLVLPAQYAAAKKEILSDAVLSLKRYNPGARTTPEGTGYNLEHLDKSARELAENIIGNLDGLAGNNLHQGLSSSKAIAAGNTPPLVNYAIVLAPFYKEDPAVRDFITRLARLKAQEISMPLTIQLLKHHISLSDTLVEYYSRNLHTRAFFYSELEKEHLEDRFSKAYLSQEGLIESVLNSQRQLNNLYNNEKGQPDSLVLVKTLPARNKYQDGRIFVYRNAKRGTGDEQWSAVFVNGPSGQISSRIEVVAAAYYINSALSEEENLNELLDHFALSYRKRAITNYQ